MYFLSIMWAFKGSAEKRCVRPISYTHLQFVLKRFNYDMERTKENEPPFK